MVLALATGPSALYMLLSLAHAALVERSLTVDVGFGRTLAFWVGSTYLALLAWGFLPRQPSGRYARRSVVLAAVGVGVVGGAVSVGFAGFWLASHWVPSVGGPVIVSLVVLVAAAVGVLRLAARDDRRAAERR